MIFYILYSLAIYIYIYIICDIDLFTWDIYYRYVKYIDKCIHGVKQNAYQMCT